MMNRRTFLCGLTLGTLCAPLAAEAQQAGKVYRIGLIANVHTRVQDVLWEALRELGYVEGQNLTIELRYFEGKVERLEELGAEMVRLKVDVIVVFTTPAALAAKNATKTIPIIFPTAIHPVASGLVASLARPGGNVTGGAILFEELSPKRLQLLKEVVPKLSRVAVLWNAANPANTAIWAATARAARALGVTLRSHEVRGPNDFESVFVTIAHDRPDAIHVLADALTFQYLKQIADFATEKRLPASSTFGKWPRPAD